MERFAKQGWTSQEVARLIAVFESERRFWEELVTVIPVPLVTVAADGTLLSANQAFLREFMIKREELERKSLTVIFGDVFWQQALMPHEAATVVMGKYQAQFTPIHRWDRGETEWSVLFLDKENATQAASSPIPPADPDLFASAASVEASQRLARRINHEINNLTMIVAGYGGELQSSLPADSPLREDVSMLLGATTRMEALGVQLGEFSRTGRSEIRAYSLRDILPPAGYQVTGVNDDPIVLTDRAALISVLSALSSIGPGTLSLDADVADHEVILTAKGLGTSAEALQHHLEPLNKAALEGHAGARECALIGPYLIQAGVRWRIADAGHLELHIPRTSERVGTVPRSALVVDDQPGIRAVVRRVLETRGFRVADAGSGEEALAIIERRNEPFDLLVTDMRMPGMTGRDLSERVRRRHPGTPVLFISGFTDDPDVQAGILPERSRFLPKPFHPDQLMDAVTTLLG